MIRILIHAGCALLTVAVASFTAQAELIEINRVTAKVNDRIVTWGEIERAMDRLNFTDEEKKKRATEFVDGKIDRLLSIYAFEEKGMGIPESIIEQEYNKRLIKEFNGDRKLFRDVLRSNGQSQLEFRDELREDIIYGHMLSTRKRLKEEISPEKVERFYRENSRMFKTEAKIKLREIVFSQIAGEPEAILMQQAKQIQDMLAQGSPFEVLAAQHGQSPFRDKGGDWGVFVSSREIRSAEIRQQAFALKKGEVTNPFTIDLLERKANGDIGKSGKIAVYLLKAEEVVAAGRKSLDDVRLEIEKILASKIEAKSQRQWFNRLKRDAFIEVSLPATKALKK
ncbi:MAG: peptidyl-prolyl cis-trans isomerase [Opitutales bacterium]|nr:peptidyl-prolyl cis-trans isomerase [Opitutales bacterium]